MSSDYLAPLNPGDVLALGPNLATATHVVDMVNDSRARCIPLSGITKTVETPDGSIKFESRGDIVNISLTTSAARILERLGPDGLKNFLSARASRRRAQPEASNQNNETENQDMAAKTKTATTDKPRRGRPPGPGRKARGG
jgi:hypothetical protein